MSNARKRVETVKTVAKYPNTPSTIKLSEHIGEEKIKPGEKMSGMQMGEKPIMLLTSESEENGVPHIRAEACYCAECNKVTALTNKINAMASNYGSSSFFDDNPGETEYSPSLDKFRGDAFTGTACSECGNSGFIIPVKKQKDGTWVTPDFIRGGWSYEQRDKTNNNIIRFEQTVITQSVKVHPDSYKTEPSMTEYNLSTDFMNGDIKAIKRRSTGEVVNGKHQLEKTGVVKDSINIYQQPDYKNGTPFSLSHSIQVFHSRPVSKNTGTYNSIINGELFPNMDMVSNKKDSYVLITEGSSRKIGMHSPVSTMRTGMSIGESSKAAMSVQEWYQLNTEAKKALLTEKFLKEGRVNPLYTDWNKNGLFLSEHHPKSTEENTDIDRALEAKYMDMLIRYPAAYEYACQRADKAVTDEYYDKARKFKANPDKYKDPGKLEDVPDSARARAFRKEMFFVANQLTACDDKVLDAIHKSKTAAEMKQQLQFFVYGDNTGAKKNVTDTIIPSNMKNVNFANSYEVSKEIAAMFNNNIIGVANTAYTCHKIGIEDETVLRDILVYAEKESPSLEAKTVKRGGREIEKPPVELPNVHAKTIRPVQGVDELRFLKTYRNTYTLKTNRDGTRNTLAAERKIAQDIIMSPDAYSAYIDSVSMYSQLLGNKSVIMFVDRKDEEKTKQLSDSLLDDRLRLYLIQKTGACNGDNRTAVQAAYSDFALDKITKPEIDEAVLRIKHDAAFDAIKAYYTENGPEKTLSHPDIKPWLAEYDAAHPDNPEEAKKAKIEALDAYVPVANREVYISCTDRKPLFEHRSLTGEYGIHGQLSKMSVKNVTENKSIEYDEKERNLEGSYSASAETPDIKYSFHLMKDKFDFVRTASDLSNCVAGGSYFDRASQEDHDKRTLCMYMADDAGRKVACIELTPAKNPYYSYDEDEPDDSEPEDARTRKYKINQFESFNDRSLAQEYAYAAVEWINDHGFQTTPNGAKEIGTFCHMDEETQKLTMNEHISVVNFHGVNADYHSNEIDEVNSTVTSISKLKELKQKRAEAAAEAYPDGIPEAPAEFKSIFGVKIRTDEELYGATERKSLEELSVETSKTKETAKNNNNDSPAD